MKPAGEPQYSSSSGCMLTVEEAYPHLVGGAHSYLYPCERVLTSGAYRAPGVINHHATHREAQHVISRPRLTLAPATYRALKTDVPPRPNSVPWHSSETRPYTSSWFSPLLISPRAYHHHRLPPVSGLRAKRIRYAYGIIYNGSYSDPIVTYCLI